MLVAVQHELRELTRVFDEVAAGGARSAVISGSVGTGKTSLLNEFTRSSRRAGAQLLACKGSALDRDVPLGVVRQLTEELALGPADGVTGDGLRRSLPHALVSALGQRAEHGPVVVSVDDAQHTDVESVKVLRDLLSSPPDARVMIVMAESPNFGPNGTGFDVEALLSTSGTCLRLGPLGRSGVRSAVTAVAGRAGDDHVDVIYRMGGGNPLLTRALVADLLTRPDSRLPSYRRAVARCLERGTPAARQVAQAAAVLSLSGIAVDGLEPTLARMLDSDESARDWALADLRAGGLIDARNQFRHEAARSVVLDGIAPERFEELNARALQVHLSEGVSSRNLAKHVVLVGRVRSRWEVDVLLDASDQALGCDDAEEALANLRVAEAGSADPLQRHRIAAGLVRVWLRTDPRVVQGELGPLVEAFADGVLDDVDASTLLRALGWNGEVDKIAELVERSGEGDSTQLGLPFVTACQTLVSRYPTIRPVVEAMRGRLGPPGAGAPEQPSPLAADAALLGVPNDEDVGAGAVRFLAEAPLTDSTIDRIELALSTAAAHGLAAQVLQRCDELLAESDRRGARTWTATLLARRADIAFRLGDLVAAHHLAEQSIGALPSRAWGVGVCEPVATAVCSAVGLGDHAAASLRLETPVPNSVYQSRVGLHYLQAKGRYYEVTGQLAAALGEFRFCASLAKDWELDSPSVVPWRTEMARVHLRLGEADRARELLDDELARTSGADLRTRGTAMMLRAEAGDVFSRSRLLEQAVEFLRRCGDRFLLQRALFALEQTGSTGPPIRVGPDVGTEVSPEPVRPRQPPAVPPRDDIAAARTRRVLTECELRVAELAARGRSNREISREAYITVSTVEQHLTKIYRKLAISGRGELAARLRIVRPSTAVS